MSTVADDVVLEALRTAVQQEGEILLVKSGKQAGLFKSRTGKANQQAIATCLKSDPPLLEITREEKGSGKTKTVKQFARITNAGINVLINETAPAEYAALLSTAAPVHQQTVMLGCLQGVQAIDAEIDRAIQTARTIHEAIMARALASMESLNHRVEELQVQRQALNEEINRLGSPPTIHEPSPEPPEIQEPRPGPPPKRPIRPDPESEDDLDYQRAISQELVFAWRDATSEEARACLEQALFNVGVEPIGTPAEIVPFDGTLHDADGEIIAGQEAEVVEQGWQLENPRGVFTLLRAQVRLPATSPP
jgi:hypothetical protein